MEIHVRSTAFAHRFIVIDPSEDARLYGVKVDGWVWLAADSQSAIFFHDVMALHRHVLHESIVVKLNPVRLGVTVCATGMEKMEAQVAVKEFHCLPQVNTV